MTALAPEPEFSNEKLRARRLEPGYASGHLPDAVHRNSIALVGAKFLLDP
jgi:hypothetical protein